MYTSGPPETLVSVNKLYSKIFTTLCKAFNIHHHKTLFYNHIDNGQVERMFGTMKRALRATTRELYQYTWAMWLPTLMYSINCTASSVTGCTSYSVMFRRETQTQLYINVGLPVKEKLEPKNIFLPDPWQKQECYSESRKTTKCTSKGQQKCICSSLL